MKRYLVFCLGSSAITFAALGCGDVRDTAKTATKTTVETVKETVGGIQEGIDEGRKGAEGADGAVLVTTHDELVDYLELSVFSIAPIPNDDGVMLVLSLSSKHDKPVRMANLLRKGSLVLLDKDGFATHLQEISSNEDSITVHPKLKEKFSFRFDGTAAQTLALRIYGHDYPTPSVVESETTPTPSSTLE